LLRGRDGAPNGPFATHTPSLYTEHPEFLLRAARHRFSEPVAAVLEMLPMRAEAQKLADDIKEAFSLLRRSL